MKESPLRGVEVIEQRDDVRIIESLIAEPLSDMGPVFLFNVRVVILVVSSASGKLDRTFPLRKMSEQVMVQELRAVVYLEEVTIGCFIH